MPRGATSLAVDPPLLAQLRVICWAVAGFWRYFLLALLLASCRLGFEPLADGRATGDGANRSDAFPPGDAPPFGVCVAGRGPGQCPGACVTGRCEIDCTTTGSCMGKVECPVGLTCQFNCGAAACENIVCATASNCIINCIGDGSCGGTINCLATSSCAITCTGDGACNGPIDCNGMCAVTCTGVGSCADVDCRDACSCNVSCGANTCLDVLVCPLPAACTTAAGCSTGPLCPQLC